MCTYKYSKACDAVKNEDIIKTYSDEKGLTSKAIIYHFYTRICNTNETFNKMLHKHLYQTYKADLCGI